ncbi:hypothetical protein NQ317_007116 [Molorchus minor]|uniref:Mid1-interacting protein 1 n=1 Tax=Molorchus minor TaxID=1323400 RepID=A0ABQ9JYA5_9CUCU|nr:hypothetical protein NQ317_007116 [Molorchus minor]
MLFNFTQQNCLRRIARNDDTEFSHQSILNVMEKFVKTVNKMDETILVPCRLMDQKSLHSVHEFFDSTDLFEIYNMLNGVKDGLLWGQSQDSVPAKPIETTKGHTRRPSFGSSNENDSGIEESALEDGKENVERIAHDFRRHLHGLTNSLRQMTEAAQYLTWRYQYDIGGPV